MDQPNSFRFPIPEYWLYWTYQMADILRNPMISEESFKVEIIKTGVQNYDNGPDFRNAVLKINHIQQMGDVEFHINLNDWFRHGHDDDERYNNVILHCLWQVPDNIPQRLKRRCCHLVLSKQLRISYSKWYHLMQESEKTKIAQRTGSWM